MDIKIFLENIKEVEEIINKYLELVADNKFKDIATNMNETVIIAPLGSN
mgnify:CR=1 FL=1